MTFPILQPSPSTYPQPLVTTILLFVLWNRQRYLFSFQNLNEIMLYLLFCPHFASVVSIRSSMLLQHQDFLLVPPSSLVIYLLMEACITFMSWLLRIKLIWTWSPVTTHTNWFHSCRHRFQVLLLDHVKNYIFKLISISKHPDCFPKWLK